MLQPDELIPEERTDPAFIQELQTHFQLKPAEQQVLQRVHEQLAKYAAPSLLQVRSSQSQPQALRPRTAQNQARWQSRLATLAAILLVGFLVGALVWTFAAANRTIVGSPNNPNVTHILLLPAQQNLALSPQAISTMRSLLAQRFSSFGLVNSSVQIQTTNGQPGFLVSLPNFKGNPQQVINPLLARGIVQFWITGPDTLPTGSSFDPARYATYNHGTIPLFTNKDIDPSSLKVVQNSESKTFSTDFAMQSAARQSFQAFTAQNIGNTLTVTLDGKVLESVIIQSAIAGTGIITDNFTQQQARAFAAILKHGSLPFDLKKLT